MRKNYSLLFLSIIIAAFLIIFSISFLNFGTKSKSQLTKIYYVDNISDTHQKIIDKFNSSNKDNIEVIPIDIPFYKFSTNERKELLMRALRSKSERVDIFAADIVWLSRFAKWSENLDIYFSEDEKENLIESAKIASHLDDKFLASPLYQDVSVMFYRKDLLSKIKDYQLIKDKLDKSITWDEFLSLSYSFKNRENFYTFPADAYEGLICSFADLIFTQESNISSKNIIMNPQSVKALSILVNLVNKYKISPKEVINYREKEAYDAFIKNDGLFVRGWQSFEKDTKNLTKDPMKEKFIEYTQLPHIKGSKIGATVGGCNLMLSKSSQKKKAAVKFIKYTLSEEAQKILYSEGAYLPVIKSVYSDSTFVRENPKIKFASEILNHGVHRPKLEEYTHISDILSFYIRAAINNEISVRNALLAAETEVKKIRKPNDEENF